jgi:hypothetical protein
MSAFVENTVYFWLIPISRWPVFSFAIDLGSVTPNNQQPDPVVWALGLVRNPLVNYVIPSGFQPRTGYYWSSYQNINDVVRARPRTDIDDNEIFIFRSLISSGTSQVPDSEVRLSMIALLTRHFKFLLSMRE